MGRQPWTDGNRRAVTRPTAKRQAAFLIADPHADRLTFFAARNWNCERGRV